MNLPQTAGVGGDSERLPTPAHADTDVVTSAVRLGAGALRTVGRYALVVEGAYMRFWAGRLEAASHALPHAPHQLGDPSAAELMRSLLSRSLVANAADAKDEHYRSVLRQLVPDEARIIEALATKPGSPVVSVLRRTNGQAVLANASLVGRTAALTVPSLTATYVTHLLELGLVQLGGEDAANETGYELLLAEADVRTALKEGEFSKVPARIVRRTLWLSQAGRDLWAVSRPENVE